MKKFMSILLALAMLCALLTGCKPGEEEASGPLRICVDFGALSSDKSAQVQNFLFNAKDYGAPENVEFEVIPPDGPERKGAITELRTEVAAGSGPDLFIISTNYGDDDRLFRFPEQVMGYNYFLKLDEYIEQARYMEWEQLEPAVMEAGRGSDGQYLLPLAYTFPVTVYRGQEAGETLTKSTPWQDMLASADPLIRGAAYMFYPTCIDRTHSVFGKIADYGEEELLFTEEELLAAYQAGAAYDDEILEEDIPENYMADLAVDFDWEFPLHSDEDTAVIPLCGLDGGVTATVTAYACINANTAQPEEAFLLLDVLMSKEFQQNSGLYGSLTDQKGLPVYQGLMQEDEPVQKWYMPEPAYQEFVKAKELITNVKFRTPLDDYLTRGYGREDVSDIYRQMKMELKES